MTYLTNNPGFQLDSNERGFQKASCCVAGYIPEYTFPEHGDKNACSRGQRPANQGVSTKKSLCDVYCFPLCLVTTRHLSTVFMSLCLEYRSVSGRRARLYRRRRFKPKKNVFSGTWSALYLIMGFASWLVWRQGGLRVQAVPLCFYLLQLAVNLWAWPPIFVGGPRRRYAFADSAGIWHSNPHGAYSSDSRLTPASIRMLPYHLQCSASCLR